MTGEVVRAELVFGVEPLGFQECGPAGQQGPMSLGETRVPVDLRDGRHEDQQVARLFDRHLVLLSLFSAAVTLTVGFGITAQVVRRKVEFPAW